MADDIKAIQSAEFLRAHAVLEAAITARKAPAQADLDRVALGALQAWLANPDGEKFRLLRDKFVELCQCSKA